MSYFIVNAPYFVLFVGLIVFCHELGHFLVARACGVHVQVFSLGFGPRLFATERRGTTYQVSLLPLGGYVKMLGDTPGVEVPEASHAKSFANKSVWQRMAIVLAGPSFNLLLALLVYCLVGTTPYELGIGTHQLPATKLGYVMQGEPAYQAGLRPGDTIVAVGDVPVQRWTQLRRLIATQPQQRLRLTFERPLAPGAPAGSSVRQVVELTSQAREEEDVFHEMHARGSIGVSMQYLRPVVAVLDAASPAARAGVRSGDTIVAVNGQPTTAWHEVRAAVAASATGAALELRLQRAAAANPASQSPGSAVPTSAPPQLFTCVLQPSAPHPELDSSLFSAADPPGGYSGLVSQDSIVSEVEPQSAAAQAGLQVGDRILQLQIRAAQGASQPRPIHIWGLDMATLGLSVDSQLSITLQRGTQVLQRPFHLQEKQALDELHEKRHSLVFGAHNDASLLETYTIQAWVGPLEALQTAAQQVADDASIIVRGLLKLVQRRIPLGSMGGPIMLFVIAEKTAKLGALYYFRMLAMISVNIGIVNFLPIPVLDGGHLVFLGMEAISHRPPSLRLRVAAHVVGFGLLLSLMLYTLGSDVLRFMWQ